jgi:hypothetical protein
MFRYAPRIKSVREILQTETSTALEILDYIIKLNHFLNTCIAYRILLTIPIRL